MFLPSSLLLGLSLLHPGQCHPSSVAVPDIEDSVSVPNDLQAFSIEIAYFPDYAGNKTHPNQYSKNLLDNFKEITGRPPVIRVGGTTQDHSIYSPDQKENIHLVYENPGDDQPKRVIYGPGFFESYRALGGHPYIHGINFLQNNISHLEAAAVEACKSLGSSLHLFELGNEVNMDPGKYLPKNYSLDDYVREWNTKSAAVEGAVQDACPGPFLGFMSPSFIKLSPEVMATSSNSYELIPTNWSLVDLFARGYDKKNLTREISMHNYMGVDWSPPIPLPPVAYDLQKTYMNHTNIVQNLGYQIQREKDLAYLGHEFTLGETNSMARQGRPGISNTFGAALWLVDYSLWSGINGIKRLQFHQGIDYRYDSWQPIATDKNQPDTRPPYYGQIMVAAALGHSDDVRVANIRLPTDLESAYAVYDGDSLSKLVVVNLQAYNSTSSSRPGREYKFQVKGATHRAKVDRLMAPGSDSLGNVTFGGVSYDYQARLGKPDVVDQSVEMVGVEDGVVRVYVPDASAALLSLD